MINAPAAPGTFDYATYHDTPGGGVWENMNQGGIPDKGGKAAQKVTYTRKLP